MKPNKWAALALALAVTAGGGAGTFVSPVQASAGSSSAADAKSDAKTAVQAPVNLRVPALAYDDTSISLVWEKPAAYAGIVDYKVYMDGKLLGTANGQTSPAKTYIDKFYADPDNGKQVKVVMHNFTATGLKPNTTYTFQVTAVDKDGNESPVSNTVKQATTPVPEVFNIEDYGAVGDGTTLNTGSIQAAIDAATPGSKVLVPAGVFKTGAIWLKSDLTLEVAEGARLLGSENPDDYPFNYYHYDYMVTPRYYSLINAQSFEEGALKNIRIVGKGIIDGNGWSWPSGKEYTPEPAGGYEDNQFPNQTVSGKGSTSDPSSPGYWEKTGVLAKSQTQRAMELGYVDADFNPDKSSKDKQSYQNPAYATRSNLILMKGVENVYYGGFTALNPANHTLVNSEDRNVTVNGVKLLTYDDNNADGIEFIHSDGLTVFNTVFDTGDDCMNFAAGQGTAGQKDAPSQNAWIFNNYFREGHGGIVEGSHTAAWIQNILAEDNVMVHTDVALRMKTNSRIGGGSQNVVFRDTAVKDASSQAFIFTSAYDDANGSLEYEPASTASEFHNVHVKNVTVDGTKMGIQVAGVVGGNHHDIHFDQVQFWNAATPTSISYMKDSSFKDVVFNGSDNPWSITNSSGLTFEGATTRGPADAADADQLSAPVWPDSAKLQTESADDTSFTFTWTAASDNVGVKGYLIAKNGSWINATDAKNNYVLINGTSYKAEKLTPGHHYRFQVFAVDATGNVTEGPVAEVQTDGTGDTIAPQVAADSRIKLNGEANTTWLNLKWNAATDNYGVDHYNVYQNGQLLGSVTGTVYNATGLRFATDYTFKVEAVDEAGNSTPYPAPLTVKTKPAYDVSAPKWPSGAALTVSSATPYSVTLSWPAAADDIGIAGYRIYVDGKPVQGDTDFTPVNAARTVAGTTFTLTGLEPDTTYTVKVEAGDVNNKWTGSGPSLKVTTAKKGSAAAGSSASGSASKFQDLGIGFSWAKDAISVMAERGIIRGTSEAGFSPSRGVTRAEFVTLLARTFKLKAEIPSNFSDVKKNAYYYEAVGTAKALGIVGGVGNNTFNPNGLITRQDMMVLLVRTLDAVKKPEHSAKADLKAFQDRSELDAYAADAAAVLVQLKVIEGEDGQLRPQAQATRAEAAVLLYRTLTLTEK